MLDWMNEKLKVKTNAELGDIAKDREKWKKTGQSLKDNSWTPRA